MIMTSLLKILWVLPLFAVGIDAANYKAPTASICADTRVDTYVENPFKIEFGGSGILKIKRTKKGNLAWFHNGNPINIRWDNHYSYPFTGYNSIVPIGTELKISDAREMHAGLYEAVLTDGDCTARQTIEVQVIVSYRIWSINPKKTTCAGETVSFEAEVTGAKGEFVIAWADKDKQFLNDNEHYSLSADKTQLTITNALPSHAGNYFAFVKYVNEDFFASSTAFHLDVNDPQLHTLVQSPVEIELGGRGILKVNKSPGGYLFWFHDGSLIVVRQNSHYKFVDTEGASGSELEISDATATQGGLYVVVFTEGVCQVRKNITVHVQASFIIRSINPNETTCTGGNVSFEAEVTGAKAEFVIGWADKDRHVLNDNEHYSLSSNNTVLTITNALPSHAGSYFAFVKYVLEDTFASSTVFHLDVNDPQLHTLLQSPVEIELGGRGILKVNKSPGGDLFWFHNGSLIDVSQDSHYTLVDTKGSSGIELEISNARVKQGGLYEVVLKKGDCQVRTNIDVQVQVSYMIRSINPNETACAGGNVSMEAEVTGAKADVVIAWADKNRQFLNGSEHYSLSANNTVLTITNTLPSHAGNYFAFVKYVFEDTFASSTVFHLDVHDPQLRTLVKSPVKIELGGRGVLKVNKSLGGALSWFHNGSLLEVSQDSHYTFVDTKSSSGTELEISDARAKQGGLYEVVLMKGGCEVRNIIDVQLQVSYMIWSINRNETVCAGGNVSFKAEVTGAKSEFVIAWADKDRLFLDDSEHYSLSENNTVLTITNALPSHAGNYVAFVKYVFEDIFASSTVFYLDFHDPQLRTLVKSPVKIDLGGRGVLKVNKSQGGSLSWFHNGRLIEVSQDSHYTFVDTKGSSGTQLEISDARHKQGGLYEVVLMKGGCEVRNIIDVQVQVSYVISSMNPNESICAGGTVSLEAEVTGAEAEFVIAWTDKDSHFLNDSEHYSLSAKNTVLTITNALPSHAGNYFAFVKYGFEDTFASSTVFHLDVHDLQLHTLVKGHFNIELGERGILKLNKSEEGDLFWFHNGSLIDVSQDSHYRFVDTEGSLGTELEISNATAKQGGLYEVVLMKGGCKVRDNFHVHLQASYMIWSINPHESTCAGGTVSFEAEVTGAKSEFVIAWTDKDRQFLDDSEHYSLSENNTVLTINDALPPHAGMYFAFVKYVFEDAFASYTVFHLDVHDTELHTLVKSHVKINLGGRSVLKVNKSEGGDLFWTHNGNLIEVNQDSHYTFVDTEGSSGTGVEIFDATAEQGGLYEVVLMEGGCEVRNIIDVQVQEFVDDTAGPSTDDSKFLGIIDLGFFEGDFTGEWYIAPLVLGLVVILLLVLIVCMIRRSRLKKRDKKEKDKAGVTRVVFEEPIYTVQDQVFYPPADLSYDIAPVTGSHPQPSSLGTYADMSMYGVDDGDMSSYDSLLGQPVPPPEGTYSEMNGLEEFYSDYL